MNAIIFTVHEPKVRVWFPKQETYKQPNLLHIQPRTIVPSIVVSPTQKPQEHKNLDNILLFCPNCANYMAVEELASEAWQATCDTCGVSGPRAKSETHAIAEAMKIFKDI